MSTHRNTNFTIDAPKPIDSRMQVASESALNGIAIKFDRMPVYALAEDTNWRYFAEDIGNPWHQIEEGGTGTGSVAWEDITGNPEDSVSLVDYLGANYAAKIHLHVPDDITPSGGFLTWGYPHVAPNYILTGSGTSIPGAVNRYTDLLDTNADYAGQALKVPEVTAGEDSLLFVDYRALVAGRMSWKNLWVSAAYKENDTVRDGDWTMIANKDTTERAAPVPSGVPTFVLPLVPTWDVPDPSSVAVIHSGHEYTFTSAGWIKELRVWAPSIDPSVAYRIVIVDITNPTVPVVRVIPDPILNEDDWATVALDYVAVSIGTVFRIYLDVLNSSGEQQTVDGWNTVSTSNTTVPTTSQWVARADGANVRMHNTSLGATYGVQLAALPVGTEIRIVETGDTNKSVTYETTGATTPTPDTADGSYTLIPTLKISEGPGGFPTTGNPATITITEFIAAATEYVEFTDFLLTGQPAWATVVGYLSIGGTAQALLRRLGEEFPVAFAVSSNAYGVDIEFQEAYVSPDWDLVAVSDGGGLGEEAGSVITIVDNLTTQDAAQALSSNMGYVLDQSKWSKDAFLALSTGASSSNQPVKTDGTGKIDISFIPAGGLPTTTVNFPVCVEFSMDKITKGDIHSIHGALIELATAQPLNNTTPITVTGGLSKLLVVAKAGTIIDGLVTFTGTSVDRTTGDQTASFGASVSITTLATDTTAPDSLGHRLVNIVDAIMSPNWFLGDVVISVNSADLTDVDVYQVAFEQFNDEQNLTIDTLDLGFLINNATAEMNVHLYAVERVGDLTDFTPIVDPVQLLAADTVADKFYRVRRGGLNKQLNGQSDGIVLAMNFDPIAQSYFEELSAKVWATVSQDVTIEAGIQSVSGDGVDNTDPRNPVMDLSDWAKTTIDETFTRELTVSNQDTDTGTVGRALTVINNAKTLLKVGYDYTKTNTQLDFGVENVRFTADNKLFQFYPDLNPMLSISGTALWTTLTVAQILTQGANSLLTKEYGDANYTSGIAINITWEALVALGSAARVAQTLYNVESSADSSKDFGRILLLGSSIFQWVDSNNQLNKITIP